MVEPIGRLPEARTLVDSLGYFVVHAPRQTGKTTTLRALAAALTGEGRFAAVFFSCEAGEPARDDYEAAERILLNRLRAASDAQLPEPLRPPEWPEAPAGTQLSTALSSWAEACPRPLVLLLDEVDALRGESLRSVLRQLRDGFPNRPKAFPASIVLCGLRDVRDYKVASGGDPGRLGTASPFNVKVKSLRLTHFAPAEVHDLYGQHTAETGQEVTGDALEHVMTLTGGQPWLVNALGREVTLEMAVPTSEAITVEHLDEAKERLILARATHLDSLVARLHEPRVRRVIEPLLAGTFGGAVDSYDDDVAYVRDLGLVAPDDPLRVANPVYREVVVRVLSATAQTQTVLDPRSFVRADGRLDLERVLREFAEFWREHGEILAGKMAYHEVAPQLVLMAYLQRVVNGGGYVDREYGVGRGRIDLLVRWPYRSPSTLGGPRQVQREALELKVWAKGRPDPLDRGLAQLDGYLARLGLDTGVLVLFDRRPEAPPAELRTTLEEATTPAGRKVTVLRA